MKKDRVTTLVLLALVLLAGLSFVSSSEAIPTIKGKYAVVGHDACVSHWAISPTGGTATTYWTKTTSIQGTIIFYENGTGVADLTLLVVTQPTYTPVPLGPYWNPATQAGLGGTTTLNMTMQANYTVDPVTRLMTLTLVGTGQFTSGNLNGKWVRSSAQTFTGYVPDDRGTIIASTAVNASPEQADFTVLQEYYYDSDFTQFYGSNQDVCHKTRTLNLIHTLQNQNQP